MIRHIVAIDSQHGLAKAGAMPPWKLKQDEAYFNRQTLTNGAMLLMGKKTFTEALHETPLKDRTNYVLTTNATPITGAMVVTDLAAFRQNWPVGKDLWIIGGATLFEQTMDWADELYITEITGDFACDRFYPAYKKDFQLISRSQPITEHSISYAFCVYKRKSLAIATA